MIQIVGGIGRVEVRSLDRVSVCIGKAVAAIGFFYMLTASKIAR